MKHYLFLLTLILGFMNQAVKAECTVDCCDKNGRCPMGQYCTGGPGDSCMPVDSIEVGSPKAKKS